jgi:hypothetical protein
VSFDFQGGGIFSSFSHLFHFAFDLVKGHFSIFQFFPDAREGLESLSFRS